MNKIDGFLKYSRSDIQYQPVEKRIKHFKEFESTIGNTTAQEQAARCMDCGVPFCQGDTGCPVDNLIPEFNELVFNNHWQEALESLESTNNFPEFTGYLCPAPCETACVLGINSSAVTIKALERAIIDRGYENFWVKAKPPQKLSGKSVAIVGSGPAGLACAQQLARAGHSVTVFEKSDRLGGLLRYGIPDFKMEKWHIDKRIDQMEQEGVRFKTKIHVGKDISSSELCQNYNALVLAMGAEDPIPINIPGTDYTGVHWAMDYLVQSNRAQDNEKITNQIYAKDKNVIVIGGGDTGSDCIGTANRQQAKSIINFRRSEQPPLSRSPSQPWPFYPDIFYTSSSHEEGVDRKFNIRPLEIIGNDKGILTGIKICKTKRNTNDNAKNSFEDIPKSEEIWDADLIFLAMGYRGSVKENLLEELIQKGLKMDNKNNILASFGIGAGSFRTSLDGIYTCGDARRGQSLIVWAISEGRKCASQIHKDLMEI